jgi:hypothetical protein
MSDSTVLGALVANRFSRLVHTKLLDYALQKEAALLVAGLIAVLDFEVYELSQPDAEPFPEPGALES